MSIISELWLLLEVNRRQVLFCVVLLVGAAAVIQLNRKKKETPKPSPAPAATNPDLMQQLLQGDPLSTEAARAWLDQLLVAQQEEDQK